MEVNKGSQKCTLHSGFASSRKMSSVEQTVKVTNCWTYQFINVLIAELRVVLNKTVVIHSVGTNTVQWEFLQVQIFVKVLFSLQNLFS